MRNFRNYQIWKDALLLAKSIYELTERLPESEKYNLKGQLFRCACSVPSNIAEGTARSTDKEFKRYLEIALGSLYEMETQLHICVLCKMIHNKEFDAIFQSIYTLEKKITVLITKLRNG
jgi:four helix bundle protein